MLHGAFFWGSFRTMLEFTLSMVIIWLGLGVAVALLMNCSFRGRSFVRSALALPMSDAGCSCGPDLHHHA
jgi:ABC-type sugar transport system permease subunit